MDVIDGIVGVDDAVDEVLVRRSRTFRNFLVDTVEVEVDVEAIVMVEASVLRRGRNLLDLRPMLLPDDDVVIDVLVRVGGGWYRSYAGV